MMHMEHPMKSLSKRANGAAGILQRIIRPEEPNLSRSAARSLLRLDFQQEDRKRMHELAVKNQEGRLGERERDQLDEYVRIGLFLDLMHSKARRCLKAAGAASRG
jgi:hypothetical protein